MKKVVSNEPIMPRKYVVKVIDGYLDIYGNIVKDINVANVIYICNDIKSNYDLISSIYEMLEEKGYSNVDFDFVEVEVSVREL